MLDGSQTPCKTHDGNLYVANTELKWDPRLLQFEIFPNVPDYDANSVSAQVLIDGALPLDVLKANADLALASSAPIATS